MLSFYKMKNIGERIYKYREKCGLSQLELAELLDVSRQSVSKWETEAAIPELAKLIRMAEIFGVSLDALVLGKETEKLQIRAEKEENTEKSKEIISSSNPTEKNMAKTVVGACFLGIGIVLSVFVMLWAPLFGLFLLIPFMLCAFFCLKQFRHATLWCFETWFVAVALYLNYGSGTNWKRIFSPQFYSSYTNEWVIAFSWIEFVLLVSFVVMTILAFRHCKFEYSRKKYISIAVTSGALFVLQIFFDKLFFMFCLHVLCHGDKVQYAHWLGQMDHFQVVIRCAAELILVAAFTACLIPTAFWVKEVIKKKKNQKLKL